MADNRKLTDEDKEAIITEYIESRIYPDRTPVRQSELAQRYGVNQGTISRIITSSDEVERLGRRLRTSTLLAQAMAQHAAPRVMAETIKDALTKRDDAFGYLSQNARRDVLERAGVRVAKDEKQEVTISFASGKVVRPKMPERESEDGE